MDRDCALLIVNADDYGYSEGISRGILEAVEEGVVTATGILANSPHFDEHVGRLRAIGGVDAGVHLNLTFGRPLTKRFARLLERRGGEFSRSKGGVALSVLSGRIDADAVEEEWDAQIRRCLDARLRIWFLNSHEHLHMLPALYRCVRRLAERHGVPFVRHARAEWVDRVRPAGFLREAALCLLDRVNRGRMAHGAPVLLGATRSGKVDMKYLRKRLGRLRAGAVYELMCHPGRPAPGEIADRRLLAYHDWEGELGALRSAKREGLFGSVHLTRYRELGEGTPGGSDREPADR